MGFARRSRLRRGPGFHWRLVLSVVSGAVGVVGAGQLLCGLYAVVDGSGGARALMVPALVVLPVAAATASATRRLRPGVLRARDGFLAVTLAWLAAAAVGAAPFMIDGTLPRAVDAMFESMSGFTTTGATLIDDVDGRAPAILLWRSLTQWLGGLGIVVLVVAAAPAAGQAMQRVFHAETSGITSDRLTPRIADTAKILWSIYLAFTVLGVAGFLAVGMGSFDAINHAFTSVASGGFSTRTASIAGFDSIGVEVVAIVLMAITSVNYAFYWRALRGQSLWPQAAEVRLFLVILVGSVAIVATSLALDEHPGGAWQAVRDAAFTVTSVISTTGYTTADFDTWNDTARGQLLMIMVVGGCAGSTAGGLKVIRVLLLGKSVGQELQRQLRPRAVQVLRIRGHVYSDDARRAVLGFFATFALVAGAGVLALLLTGLDLESAVGAVAATITLVGPGLGEVGASENFQAVDSSGRGVLTFLMLVGRLELFTVLVLLTPGFWRGA